MGPELCGSPPEAANDETYRHPNRHALQADFGEVSGYLSEYAFGREWALILEAVGSIWHDGGLSVRWRVSHYSLS